MTQDTCSALVNTFPFLFLIVLLEGRAIRPRYRKTVYKWVVGVASMSSLIGLAYSIVGVQLCGLGAWGDAPLWVVFGITLCGLIVVTLVLAVTFDEADKRSASHSSLRLRALLIK